MTKKEEIVLAKLEGLKELMDTRFESVDNALHDIEKSVDHMRDVVVGNGKPGLIEQVNTNTKILRVFGTVIALFVTALITAIVNGWLGL